MPKPSPCIEKGCYRRSVPNGSRCLDHSPKGYSSKRAERLPDDWRNLSRFILLRDNYLCYICKDPTFPADGVDHIQRGDDHSPDNLAAIHHNAGPKCHLYKTAQEGNQAKKDNRAQVWGNYWAQEYKRRQLPPSERAPF